MSGRIVQVYRRGFSQLSRKLYPRTPPPPPRPGALPGFRAISWAGVTLKEQEGQDLIPRGLHRGGGRHGRSGTSGKGWHGACTLHLRTGLMAASLDSPDLRVETQGIKRSGRGNPEKPCFL